MNTNLYFLVSINAEGVAKLEITINPFSASFDSGAQPLPINFLNVSGFNNLQTTNPDLLPNLAWLDRPDLGFWLAIFDVKPVVSYYKKIITTNTINQSEKTVSVSYTEVELTLPEVEEKNSKMRTSYVPVRDSYLKLTDFTQLADAPITEQARLDFATFRQQLRDMFNIVDYSQLAWPPIPTSAPNIIIPPFPPIDFS